MSANQQQSIIVTKDVQLIKQDQFQMNTWFIIVFLIVAFVVLKSFIYIKDQKRHGK